MEKLMIKPINKLSNLLSAGLHLVALMAVAVVFAAAKEEYKDRTPQLQVLFKTPDGKKQFTNWYNLKGFVKYADLSKEDQNSGKFRASSQGYAVDIVTGERIESPEATAECMSIIGKLAHDAGFRGAEIDPEQLIGKHVGIKIAPNTQGNDRVVFTTSEKYATENQEA